VSHIKCVTRLQSVGIAAHQIRQDCYAIEVSDLKVRRIQSLNRLVWFDVPSATCIVDQRKGFDKATSRHPLQTEIEAKNERMVILSVARISPHSSRSGRRSSNM